MAKSAKPFRPVAVTANDLRSGVVVYRDPGGGWSTDLGKAEIAESPEAAEILLAAATADHDANIVVEPVLVEIASGRPSTLRERIRSLGPTVGAPHVPL